MKTINIVGVPEHFNLPWQLCIENEDFLKKNIRLNWTDIPEGTGKMCQMLRNKEADIAVILTEGIIKDITEGNKSKIVQIYVKTPLIWGIHVAAQSQFNALEDLKNTKVAISRIGSGSQLMAYVNADNNNWNTENMQFEIVNTINGAVDALSNGNADYFMWERFMTQPLVDNGTFRRLGECPTPWPCFVIAVREELLENDPESIHTILEIINNKTSNFKNISDINIELSNRYNHKIEAVNEWLTLTEWSQENLTEEMLNKIQNKLLEINIINKKATFVDIVKA